MPEDEFYLRFYKRVVAQQWLSTLVGMILVLILGVLVTRWVARSDIQDLKEFIQHSKCTCRINKSENSGNVNVVNVGHAKTHADLVEEVLKSRGEIR